MIASEGMLPSFPLKSAECEAKNTHDVQPETYSAIRLGVALLVSPRHTVEFPKDGSAIQSVKRRHHRHLS